MSKLTTPDHLLVIDPCPDTQARIAEQLQGRGFSVVAASDPTTALTTIDMAAPDIVITELFLPEATGLILSRDSERSANQKTRTVEEFFWLDRSSLAWRTMSWEMR